MTQRVGRGMRRLTLATVILTYLLVIVGGVVRVTGSGLGCGVTGQDWPVCHGGLVPPPDPPTLIEFSHRMFATASTILIVATLIVAWARYRHERRITGAATAAVVLLIIQILLGGITVELKLAGPVVMVHLANAMLLLGVLVYLAVVVVTAGTGRDERSLTATRLRRLTVAAAVATYVLVLSGSFVVANGDGGYCSAWPICGNGFELPAGEAATINVAHRFIAGIVALFIGYVMAMVLRSTAERGVRAVVMAVNVVLLVQILMGAAMVETHLQAFPRGAHIALASALWALTLAVALIARRASLRQPAGDAAPAPTAAGLHRATG